MGKINPRGELGKDCFESKIDINKHWQRRRALDHV